MPDSEQNGTEAAGLDNTLRSSIAENIGAKSESAPVERSSNEPVERSKPGPEKTFRGALRDHLRGKEPPAPARDATRAQPVEQQAAPAQEQFEPIAPPADMRKELHDEFRKLPPGMQKWLSQRAYEYRSDYSRKTMEASQVARENQAIHEAMAPHRDEYIRQGINPADLVRRAIAWDRAFKQDRHAAAREYLESYGIHPSELLMEGEPVQQQDPGYLTREEAMELARQEIERANDLRAQEESTRNSFNAVQKFIGSKPLFRDPGTAAQLEQYMAPIVAGLRDADPSKPVETLLDEAYVIATTHESSPFRSLVQQLNAKPQIERTRQEAQEALNARRSISGGPGSGSPIRKAESLRENLRLRITGGM